MVVLRRCARGELLGPEVDSHDGSLLLDPSMLRAYGVSGLHKASGFSAGQTSISAEGNHVTREMSVLVERQQPRTGLPDDHRRDAGVDDDIVDSLKQR